MYGSQCWRNSDETPCRTWVSSGCCKHYSEEEYESSSNLFFILIGFKVTGKIPMFFFIIQPLVGWCGTGWWGIISYDLSWFYWLLSLHSGDCTILWYKSSALWWFPITSTCWSHVGFSGSLWNHYFWHQCQVDCCPRGTWDPSTYYT